MKNKLTIISAILIVVFGCVYYTSAKISNPSSVDTSSFLTSAVTSLNGSTSSTQAFATSSDTNVGLSIGTAGGTHTFTSVWNGLLAIARGGTGTSTTPSNGQLLIGNGTDYTVANLAQGNGAIITNTSGGINVATQPKFQYFVMESPTSTEDIYVFTPRTTTTISQAYAVNKTASDTVTWNLVWDNSRATATSSVASKLFATATTTTATTTPASYTSFASTTITAGQAVRFITTSASSTQFGLTIHYNESN